MESLPGDIIFPVVNKENRASKCTQGLEEEAASSTICQPPRLSLCAGDTAYRRTALEGKCFGLATPPASLSPSPQLKIQP